MLKYELKKYISILKTDNKNTVQQRVVILDTPIPKVNEKKMQTKTEK